MPEYILNWRPSPPDPRDFLYKRSFLRRLRPLPDSTDLSKRCSPIVDQGELGSCTACAIVSGLREYLAINTANLPERLSRLYLYHEEREIEGTTHLDWGAYIVDGFKVLVNEGVPPERLWPYNIGQFAIDPPPNVNLAALPWRIKKYERIYGIQAIKECLADGFPVVAGMDVFRQMIEDAGRTGIVSVPRMFDESMGGHAVTIVGYQDTPRGPAHWKDGGWFKVRNSWGETWGNHGHFRIAYAYVTRGHMSEFWTAR
jgi:C1A family cysteine protease